MTDERPRINDMERHAQTILALIVVALLIWVGTTTQDASVKIAALEVQVNALQVRIDTPSPSVMLLIDQNKEMRSRILNLESHLHNAGVEPRNKQ